MSLLPLAAPGAVARADASWERFPLEQTLGFGQSANLWTEGATALDLELTAPEGVTFSVDQNGKAWPPSYTDRQAKAELAPSSVVTVAPSDTPVRVAVQWSFPTTSQHFRVQVLSFTTIDLNAAWLFGDAPELTPPSALPVLAVMGDSISVGVSSGGPKDDSAGYADRFGSRWAVTNFAVAGTSATCYGQYHTADVVEADPSAVLIAYGTNDITGDYFGCRGTIDDFRSAMATMISDLQAGLPDAQVFVSSILPRAGDPGTQVPLWNAVLAQVADQFGVAYVDPSGAMTLPGDFVDGLHPNAGGHLKLAQFWLDTAFQPGAVTVTATNVGTGGGTVESNPPGIDCPPVCTAAFPIGTTVTLTATADAASRFDGWSGGGCGGTAPCAVTADRARSVVAAFADVEPPTPPVFSAPTATFTLASPFSVTWSSSDLDSGVASYDVRFRSASSGAGFGAYRRWLSGTTATQADFAPIRGFTYCFSARAADVSGNISGWGSERCTAAPLDDRALTVSGPWTRGSGSGFYRRTYTASHTFGSKLIRADLRAKRLTLVAERCPGCGTVRIMWNGVLLRTLPLTGETTVKQVRIPLTTFAAPRFGTITIEVVSHGERVVVDGLGVSAV